MNMQAYIKGHHRIVLMSAILLLPAILAIVSSACSQESAEQYIPSAEYESPPDTTILVSNLAIDSPEVVPNQELTVTANITNITNIDENYQAELKINGILEEERMVSIPASGTETLCFSVCKCLPGSYKVTLDDLTGYFLVLNDAGYPEPITADRPTPETMIAPSFTGIDILTGKTINFSEYKGKKVLLNFVNFGCSSHLSNVAEAQLLVIRDLQNKRDDFVPISISCGCCSPQELRVCFEEPAVVAVGYR